MYANVHSLESGEKNHARRAGRTAVILNANAKKVGGKVQRQVRQSLPESADLFFTESLEQAEFTIRRVVDSGYQTIVTGGGDGTVAHAIDTALQRREQKGYTHCPRFAVLKLGTGNAVADYLGARQFQSELQNLDKASYRWLDLLKVNGRRATFAGIGWDAYILNNYDSMRQVAERFGPTRALFKSVAGYLAAGVLKSAPELAIKRPSWNVRVYNTGGFGLKLDPSGRVIERVAPGSLIYEGPIRMACVGTTPFYGFKLNIMPFADTKDGMFHLRLIDMHPLYAVTRLPMIWKGHLDHPKLRDFQLSGCRIESDEPAPFQIAGDAAGETHRIDVGLEHPVRCASFNAQ